MLFLSLQSRSIVNIIVQLFPQPCSHSSHCPIGSGDESLITFWLRETSESAHPHSQLVWEPPFVPVSSKMHVKWLALHEWHGATAVTMTPHRNKWLVWSLHVFPMSAGVLSMCCCFLPHWGQVIWRLWIVRRCEFDCWWLFVPVILKW